MISAVFKLVSRIGEVKKMNTHFFFFGAVSVRCVAEDLVSVSAFAIMSFFFSVIYKFLMSTKEKMFLSKQEFKTSST